MYKFLLASLSLSNFKEYFPKLGVVFIHLHSWLHNSPTYLISTASKLFNNLLVKCNLLIGLNKKVLTSSPAIELLEIQQHF